MAIQGTLFQDHHWKSVKDLLVAGGSACIDGPAGFDDWQARLLETLAENYSNPRCNEEVNGRAVEMAVAFKRFRDRFDKFLSHREESHRKVELKRILSDLRYKIDADHYQQATGVPCSETRMRQMALLEHLNRQLDNLLAAKNLEKLSELAASELPENCSGEELLARFTNEELRPLWLIRLDQMQKDQHGNPLKPKLSSKKYGPLTDPGKIAQILQEIHNPLQYEADFNLAGSTSPGAGFEDAISVIAGAVEWDDSDPSPAQDGNVLSFPERGSPRIEDTNADTKKYHDAAVDCAENMKPEIRNYILLQQGWENFISLEDRAAFAHGRITQKGLADQLGVTLAALKKQAENAQATFIDCILSKLPKLRGRDD